MVVSDSIERVREGRFITSGHVCSSGWWLERAWDVFEWGELKEARHVNTRSFVLQVGSWSLTDRGRGGGSTE
jgi:hypothetical protein